MPLSVASLDRSSHRSRRPAKGALRKRRSIPDTATRRPDASFWEEDLVTRWCFRVGYSLYAIAFLWAIYWFGPIVAASR